MRHASGVMASFATLALALPFPLGAVHSAGAAEVTPAELREHIEARPELRQQMTVPRDRLPLLRLGLDRVLCTRTEVPCLGYEFPDWVPRCAEPDRLLGQDLSDWLIDTFALPEDATICESALATIVGG